MNTFPALQFSLRMAGYSASCLLLASCQKQRLSPQAGPATHVDVHNQNMAIIATPLRDGTNPPGTTKFSVTGSVPVRVIGDREFTMKVTGPEEAIPLKVSGPKEPLTITLAESKEPPRVQLVPPKGEWHVKLDEPKNPIRVKLEAPETPIPVVIQGGSAGVPNVVTVPAAPANSGAGLVQVILPTNIFRVEVCCPSNRPSGTNHHSGSGGSGSSSDLGPLWAILVLLLSGILGRVIARYGGLATEQDAKHDVFLDKLAEFRMWLITQTKGPLSNKLMQLLRLAERERFRVKPTELIDDFFVQAKQALRQRGNKRDPNSEQGAEWEPEDYSREELKRRLNELYMASVEAPASRRGKIWLQDVLIGIAAAALVTVFLRLVHSDLLDDGEKRPWLSLAVLFGAGLLAGILGTEFIIFMLKLFRWAIRRAEATVVKEIQASTPAPPKQDEARKESSP
jgi:hypothetical protein